MRRLALWLSLPLLLSIAAAEPAYRIPDVVLFAIQNNECFKDKGLCDPFIIRLNKKKDIEKARASKLDVKSVHLFCESKEKCAIAAQRLIDIGITNIDLGPYQVNYYWNGQDELSGYFDMAIAEQRARTILRRLIDRHGYSWRTLGRYHHYDPDNKKRNQAYYRRLRKYIYGT